MKIHWGHKITFLFIAFGAMIATLVYKSVNTQFDLVSPEYYKEELAYQNIIDATANARQLPEKTRISVTGDSLYVEIPAVPGATVSEGVIVFYLPINAKLDRRFILPSSPANTYAFPLSTLTGPRYTVKVDWTAGNRKYHTESDLVLK